MPTQLTADDARVSLNAHVAAKGAELHAKYGPVIGWRELKLILEDRACVRYPCVLEFESTSLQSGEFARESRLLVLRHHRVFVVRHLRYQNAYQ